MKKSHLAISIAALACAFAVPAHASSFETAAGAKQQQTDQVAKKGKAKKPKAAKKGAA